jgi:hypothetical protein
MMPSSRTQPAVSARDRYGRSSGMTMSGASATSFCVPSSFELDTSARFTPLLRSSSAACFGGTISQASWE